MSSFQSFLGRNSQYRRLVSLRYASLGQDFSIARLVHTDRTPFQQNKRDQHPFTMGTARFYDGTTDGQRPTLDFRPGFESGNLRPNEEVVVKATNIRHSDPPATLVLEGCEYVHSPSTIRAERITDADAEKAKAHVESIYFPECASIVKSLTKATKCVPFHWRLREQEQKLSVDSSVRFISRPVKTFHIDNDKETAEMHLRRAVGDDEAAHWLSRHWVIVNVWRPVGTTVEQWPLAILDGRSQSFPDCTQLIATTPVHTQNNYKSHFSAVWYRPHYKFYYVNKLTPDEAILFIDYDSRQGGSFSGIAHGAFKDHKSPRDASLRRSIEVRVLALLD